MQRRVCITSAVTAVLLAAVLIDAPFGSELAPLIPALLLGAALWCNWFPAETQIARLSELARTRGASRRTAADWRIPTLSAAAFRCPAGHVLGLSLAVRPPPA